jgi:hypothetical protein
MDPLRVFKYPKKLYTNVPVLMFFPFVIPDAVLQCHKDATESNIIEECAKFPKYAPERSEGVLRTRPDN